MGKHKSSEYEKRQYVLKNIDLFSSIPVLVLIALGDLVVLLLRIPGDFTVGSRNFASIFSLKVTILIFCDLVIFYFGFRLTRHILKKLYG